MGKAVLAPHDIVSLLESTYRFDQDDDVWLTQLITEVAPQIQPGGGGAAYFLDVSNEARFRAWGWRGVGESATKEAEEGFAAWNATVPIEFKRQIHLFGPCGVASQLPRDPAFAPESMEISNEAHRVPDMFGINAVDSTGRGCALVGFLGSSPVDRLGADVEALWARISAHWRRRCGSDVDSPAHRSARIPRTRRCSRPAARQNTSAEERQARRLAHC